MGDEQELRALYQQLKSNPQLLSKLQRDLAFLDPKELKKLSLSGKWTEAESYVVGFLPNPVQWREKTPLTVALFELRVQKYKEFLERREDVQALQVLRSELYFLNTIGEGKRYRILASLIGYPDIREHKLFTRQTEPSSSKRQEVYDRVIYQLRHAPELQNRIKIKEKHQAPFSPSIPPQSVSSPQIPQPTTQSPIYSTLGSVQPIPSFTPPPPQAIPPHTYHTQPPYTSPISSPLHPGSPLAPTPQPIPPHTPPPTYLPPQPQMPHPSLISAQHPAYHTTQQNVPLTSQQPTPQSPIPQNFISQNSTLQQPIQYPTLQQPAPQQPTQQAIPQQPIAQNTQNTYNTQDTQDAQDTQNPRVRRASSPLENDRVKREKIDSDISRPPPHAPTNGATQDGAAQDGAAQANGSVTQNGTEGERQKYEVSFPFSLKQTLTINDGFPTALEFHPINPIILIIGTSTSSLELWDITAAAQRTSFKQTTGKITALQWSPDGTYFAVASENSFTVIAYQLTARGSIEKYREFVGHHGRINALVFSDPERNCIVTCSDDCTIKIWDFATGTLVKNNELHKNPVISVNVIHTTNPVQDLLVGTCISGVISFVFFDERTDQVADGILEPGEWASHTATIHEHFLTCGKDAVVEWDLSEGGIKLTYADFKRAGDARPRIHKAGGNFFACHVDRRIHFWEAPNPEPVYRLDVGSEVATFALNSQFNLLISAGKENHELSIFANQKGEEYIWHQPAGSVSLKYSAVLPPESTSGTLPATTATPKIQPLPTTHKTPINYLACCEEGNTSTLVSISYSDVTISVTSLSDNPYTTKRTFSSFSRDFSSKKPVVQALFNKKGTTAMLLSNTLLELYPFDGKKITAYSTKPKEENTVMTMQPNDNNILAIASTTGTINVVNIKDRKQHPVSLEKHTKPVLCLAFSEKMLLSANDEHKIVFWEHDPSNPCNYKFKYDIHFRGPRPEGAQFHPNNSRFFLFIQNDCLSIYDLTTNEKSARYMDGIQNLGYVVGACYSRTGKYVYCVYGSGTVHVFDHQLQVKVIIFVEGKPEFITASHQNETEFFVSSAGRIYSISATDSPETWTIRA